MANTTRITVRSGYHPKQLAIAAGEATTLEFRREEGGACSREIVFPTLGIRRELPTGKTVEIAIPASAAGTIPFTCGMNMMKGEITVR
ncbi:MAG: cupredoxin domain-containing protein [Deltaproteobacteria bacterium]|nr:cupredoxin domain-containing protein [Deltaproteobacteria bacterium]